MATQSFSVEDVRRVWSEVLHLAKLRAGYLKALLADASPYAVVDDLVILAAKFKFHADRLSQPNELNLITQCISTALGTPEAVRVAVIERGRLSSATVNGVPLTRLNSYQRTASNVSHPADTVEGRTGHQVAMPPETWTASPIQASRMGAVVTAPISTERQTTEASVAREMPEPTKVRLMFNVNFDPANQSRKLADKPNGWKFIIICVMDDSLPRGAKGGRFIQLTGYMPQLQPDIEFEGWVVPETDERYRAKRAYRLLAYSDAQPNTIEGILQYLSENIEGIGPTYAQRIVAAFGLKTPDVLSQNTAAALLTERAGLPIALATSVARLWKEQEEQRNILIMLSSAGLTQSQAIRTVEKFKSATAAVVKRNPYRLTEVERIGFELADKVAMYFNFDYYSPERAVAALAHVIKERAREYGDCYTWYDVAIPVASALAKIPHQSTHVGDRQTPSFDELIERGTKLKDCSVVIVMLDDAGRKRKAIYPKELYDAEQRLFRNINNLSARPANYTPAFGDDTWRQLFSSVDTDEQALSSEQEKAVQGVLMGSKVSVITGGPGTGKTTTLKQILSAARRGGMENIILCAPTGKAARRMHDSTHEDAYTIHRLLYATGREYESEFADTDLGDQQSKQQLPRLEEADLVVVDEASMVDVVLASKLLEAVGSGTRVLFVGDVNQLRSIGPGRVLGDMIDGGLPTFRLTRVYRQTSESSILKACQRINQGQAPTLVQVRSNGIDQQLGDMFHISANTPKDVGDEIARYVATYIAGPSANPLSIKVLTLVKDGPAGVKALNVRLQEVFNPLTRGKKEVDWTNEDGAVKLRVGDLLMWRRNQPALGLVNGSELVVEDISTEVKKREKISVVVQDLFSGRIHEFDLTELYAVHSYAITVHKAQGSEYPEVVFALHKFVGQKMQTRNLVYTAISRAQKLCLVVGGGGELAQAARTPTPQPNTQTQAHIREVILKLTSLS